MSTFTTMQLDALRERPALWGVPMSFVIAYLFVVLVLVGLVSFSTISAGLIAPACFTVLTFLEGHFITPTIVNGRVYVGTTNGVGVFGTFGPGAPTGLRIIQ